MGQVIYGSLLPYEATGMVGRRKLFVFFQAGICACDCDRKKSSWELAILRVESVAGS